MRTAWLLTAVLAVSGCALKGDVRRVERQLQGLRAETTQSDSARAEQLEQVLAFQQRALDSLSVLVRRVTLFQGDMRTDLTEVQRQLVQIQELTGQSQQRLTELRSRLDRRDDEVPATGALDDQRAGRPAGPAGADIGAQQLYDLSLQQLRRGSPQTARAGFRKLLSDFPQHPLAGDAQFFIGESWEEANADSAAVAYEQVVRRYSDSRHAPTALYRLGLIAERRGDRRAAQVYYSRVVAGYPRSEEAQLARAKLGTPQR